MIRQPWVRLDIQDGTNCSGGCGMTLRGCQEREPGEVDVRCCGSCSHPERSVEAGVVQMTHTDWETLRHLINEDLRREDYPELRPGAESALAYMDGLEQHRRRAGGARSGITLNEDARTTLNAAGVTEQEWTRRHFGEDATAWHGDACGCPDGRCIGYHHDETDDCGCLSTLLAEIAGGGTR